MPSAFVQVQYQCTEGIFECFLLDSSLFSAESLWPEEGGSKGDRAIVMTGGTGTILGIERGYRRDEMGCGRGIDLLRAPISSII